MERRSVILVLGWEPITLSQIHIGLEDAGYVVHTVQHLDDSLAWLQRSIPDLIVLDGQADAPAYDPWKACQTIEQATPCPIVMLLAEGSPPTEALKLGAADCLVRPFHMQELIARIQRIIWRMREAGSQHTAFPRLSLNPINQAVTLNGAVVHLTPTEFRLLYTLFVHVGETLSYKQLQEALWGRSDPARRNLLKQFIWQLRQKLEINPRLPRLILTKPEVGYRLRLEE
jgi:two-component system KDP operon response regulator KdpE